MPLRSTLTAVLVVAIAQSAYTAVSTQDSTPSSDQVHRSAFEAASVRRDLEPGKFQPSGARLLPSGRFNAALSLTHLIMYAYEFDAEQIKGGPEELMKQRFIIAAKAPEEEVLETGVERQMLKSLLADRFGLRVRIETEPQEVLVLRRERMDRLGPKLVRLPMPCIGGMRIAAREESRNADGERCAIATRNERMRGTVRDMEDFATYLSLQARRPVRNETGLEGSYSVDVTYDPGTLVPFRNPSGSPFASFPTVSDAFKNDLGLRLDRGRGSVRVLLVDHVEPPTEN